MKEFSWYFTSDSSGVVEKLKIPHGYELSVKNIPFNKDSLEVLTTWIKKSRNISIDDKITKKRDQIVCDAIWDLREELSEGSVENNPISIEGFTLPDRIAVKHGDKILFAIFIDEFLSCFKTATVKVKIVAEIVKDEDIQDVDK